MSFRFLVVASYLALAGAWIFLSDRLLLEWAADVETTAAWQSAKGLVFVAVSAAFIYWLAGGQAARGAQVRSEAGWRIPAATLAIFLASLSFGAVLMRQVENERVTQRRARAFDHAVNHAHAVEVQIDRAVSATYALAAMIRRAKGGLEPFEELAAELLPRYEVLGSLAVAPGGVVAGVVPLAGNERVIGIDILGDPARRPEALLAIRGDKPTLAGPLLLQQGVTGLIGRLAVFLDTAGERRFWGFVTAGIRLDDLLESANLGQIAKAGYGYELARLDTAGGRHIVARAGDGELTQPVMREMDIYGRKWVLSIAPAGGWHAYPALLAEGLMVLLASALLAWVAHTLLRQPVVLKQEVARRTGQLAEANRHLEREVTARREAQQALTRLNRALRVLSQGNAALVRAEDEASLLQEVCRMLAETGGYCLVWVAMLEPDGASLRLATLFPGGALDPALLELAAHESEQGFVGTALRERQPVLSSEVKRDPIYGGCAGSVEQCACHAGAALPLASGNALLGVLVVHTHEHDVFAPEELAILRELADDLGYGIGALRTGQALKLRDRAIESSGEGLMISAGAQDDFRFTYVNPAFERMTGYTRSEVLGHNGRFLLGEESAQIGFAEIRLALHEGRECRALLRSYRKDGSVLWIELSVSPVRGRDGGVSHFVWVMHDISERKRYEEQLEHQANHDELTGLPNRNLLADRLDQAIVRAGREAGEMAVLVVDLDNFRMVQDSLGHLAGDQLIRQVAARLAECVREGDTVASVGGDNFVLVLAGCGADAVVQLLKQRIHNEMARAFLLAEREIVLNCSIGISLYPRDGTDRETLLRSAHAAMHEAKTGGGGSFRFFTAEMNQRVQKRLSLEGELRKALASGELELHYQPQVDLASGGIVGAEALVRWRHPQRGLVPPVQFIPIAEETGLIVPMGEWILNEACRQQQAWLAAGLPAGRIGVNLSARQLVDTDLVALAQRVLQDTGLAPDALELEVTESMAMRDVDAAVRILADLQRIGVRASLDDFGTGHSSLRYLKLFSVIALKIDRLFVRNVAANPDNAVIVATIIAMAHNLGLRVIAEGVETPAELAYLRSQRCDEMQGYYFSPPLPAAQYETLLAEGRCLPASGDGHVGRTLLLVDAEPQVLSALSRLLRRDGYRILVAGSAQEGLDLLALHRVQVIVSDQRMPDMTGTEFLARVKQLHPHTVRIVLSGYTELKALTEAVNRGAIYQFLTKPWEDAALRGTVRQAFRMQERGQWRDAQ